MELICNTFIAFATYIGFKDLFPDIFRQFFWLSHMFNLENEIWLWQAETKKLIEEFTVK